MTNQLTRRAETVQRRAAIYCRVSSSGQEDNSSLGTQEAGCRAFAETHGFAVTAVYRDVHTGAEVFERPQLTELRTAMRAGAFEVLIVHALDRLSRKQTHQGLILSEAEHASVEWQSVTEDIDNSPQGQILRAVIGGMAEMERLKISERTVRGRLARARSGKLLPGKAALFGYRWRDAAKSAYDIDPLAGPLVQRIFNSNAQGQTIRSIAAQLTQEGIMTPSGGTHWSPSTIHTILKQPLYTGEGVAWRYATEKKRGGGSRILVRPESEQVRLPAGTVPQLIDELTFEAVKARLRRNQEQASRNNADPTATLLRGGYVRCGYCHTIFSVLLKDGLRYYRHGMRQLDRHGCASTSIRSEHLDDAVWNRVVSILMQPEIIEKEIDRLKGSNPVTADLELINRQMETVRRKQSNLVKRLAMLDDETGALVVAELNALGSQKRDLQVDHEFAEKRRSEWETLDGQLSNLSAYCKRVSTNLLELTYDEKRSVLDALGIGVLLFQSNHSPRYEITASLPVDSDIVSIAS